MDTRNGNRYEMLRRVKEFGAAHADSFPAGSVGAQLFAKVGDAITEVIDIATSEGAGHSEARSSVTTKSVARAVLRDALMAISQTARAMSADTPGLEDKFRVPKSRDDQQLLIAARTFLHDATPLEAAFVAHNMPATVLADLQKAIDAFEQAFTDHSNAKLSHVGAHAGLGAAVLTAVGAVRRLDAIVANTFRGNADTLAVWRSARRIEPLPEAAARPAPAAAMPAAAAAPSPAAPSTPAAAPPAVIPAKAA